MAPGCIKTFARLDRGALEKFRNYILVAASCLLDDRIGPQFVTFDQGVEDR